MNKNVLEMKTVYERIEELELTLWSARKHIRKLDDDFVPDYLHDSKMILMDGNTEKVFTINEVKDLMRDAMVQMSDWKNEGHTTPTLEKLMDKLINEKTRCL